MVNTAQLRILTLNGEDGDDTITGSPDDDIINGGAGGGDLVRGGPGTDSAQVDKYDVYADVENVDRPKHAVVIKKHGKIKYDHRKRPYVYVTVACEDECEGRVTVLKRQRVIGRAKYALDAGQEKRIKVSLAKGVKRHAKVRVVAN